MRLDELIGIEGARALTGLRRSRYRTPMPVKNKPDTPTNNASPRAPQAGMMGGFNRSREPTGI